MNRNYSRLLLDQDRNEGEVSLAYSKSSEGRIMKLSFPGPILNEKEPYVAALFAVPIWWQDWVDFS